MYEAEELRETADKAALPRLRRKIDAAQADLEGARSDVARESELGGSALASTRPGQPPLTRLPLSTGWARSWQRGRQEQDAAAAERRCRRRSRGRRRLNRPCRSQGRCWRRGRGRAALAERAALEGDVEALPLLAEAQSTAEAETAEAELKLNEATERLGASRRDRGCRGCFHRRKDSTRGARGRAAAAEEGPQGGKGSRAPAAENAKQRYKKAVDKGKKMTRA